MMGLNHWPCMVGLFICHLSQQHRVTYQMAQGSKTDFQVGIQICKQIFSLPHKMESLALYGRVIPIVMARGYFLEKSCEVTRFFNP